MGLYDNARLGHEGEPHKIPLTFHYISPVPGLFPSSKSLHEIYKLFLILVCDAASVYNHHTDTRRIAAFIQNINWCDPVPCGVTLYVLSVSVKLIHTLCSFAVVLLAASPSYFRGFTLISLKEGREGITEDDYTGQFQVRISWH